MEARVAIPYVNLFMGKEERTIIQAFIHLVYLWERFIDYIFYLPSFSHPARIFGGIYEHNQPYD